MNAHTYGGRDLETGEEVVVKIFSDSDGGRGKARFQREAKLHEALDHEAILPLLDHNTEGGVVYIVTRRLRPGSVWEMLRNDPTPSLATVRSIGIRIAGALAYMHGRGEVHGDISPGNILLDESGRAFLADFGFSKRIETTPIATSGDAHGTAGFRAPREPGTARTSEDDLYSLAAVLWFCLTARTPAHWAKARRRELPSRKLRAPLEAALRWGESPVQSAVLFAESLEKEWAGAAEDWRLRASRRRRSPVPALIAVGLVGLLLALLLGQVMKPKPVDAASASVTRNGVTLRLQGEWRGKDPPDLPALRLRKPAAAVRGRTTVVAGRAPLGGPGLIPPQARKALPRDARAARAVEVGPRSALSYGPASQFGGSVEVLALPLANSVLVVRCGGPTPTLARICAQAAADVTLADGDPQPLAPDQGTARRIRIVVNRFGEQRRRARAVLAAASDPSESSSAALLLARMTRSLARQMKAIPVNAQVGRTVRDVISSAGRAAKSYARLADSSTTAGWVDARLSVLARERVLEEAIESLRKLRVYPRSSR